MNFLTEGGNDSYGSGGNPGGFGGGNNDAFGSGGNTGGLGGGSESNITLIHLKPY